MNDKPDPEDGSRQTDGLVLSLVAFVAGYALFDILPVLLTQDTGIHELRIGDVVDAPLVLLPLAGYVLLGLKGSVWRDGRWAVIVAVLLAVFVQGHAIHLAANAIAAADHEGSASWSTTYFLDEHWGHVELHLAIVLLAAVLVVAGRTTVSGALSTSQVFSLLLSCVIYGSLLAADAIEGQTVPLMIPAALVIVAVAAYFERSQSGDLRDRSGATFGRFFGLSFALALAELAVYGLANGGYPELLS